MQKHKRFGVILGRMIGFALMVIAYRYSLHIVLIKVFGIGIARIFAIIIGLYVIGMLVEELD